MKKTLFFSLLCLFGLSSCVKDGVDIKYTYYDEEDFEMMSKTLNINQTLDDYTLETPKYIANSFFPTTSRNSEVLLGRVLFYDKNLSKDKKISCASCHDQKLGFSDNKAFSEGSNGKLTTRNSLALGSVLNFSVYYGDERFGRVPFFWDNSATTVQEQSERTLANPNEMDMHIDEVVDRVKKLEYYGPLFEKAYKDGVYNNITGQYDKGITSATVLGAIASFVNAIPAYHTKWDAELEKHYLKTGNTFDLVDYDFSGYSAIENKGRKLYLTNCASCHGETIGSPTKTRANNGLAMSYKDSGIKSKSGLDSDDGKFKVPTLRNILLSAPYMHDGSLATIDDVLNHYSNGVNAHKNLDPELKVNGLQPKKMNFTNEDKEAFKAFFETLTDYELLNDQRFSDPFKR